MKFKNFAIVLGVMASMAALSSCHDDDTTIVIPGPGEVEITPATDVTSLVDADFAAALAQAGYIDNAAKIIDSTLTKITVLNINGNPLRSTGKLTSLKGVELMTNLTELSAKSQALTALDLSKNVNLTDVEVSNNALTSLTLPAGAPLQIVNAGRNQLTDFVAEGYSQLTKLDVSYNELSSITLSGLNNLATLYINNNQLTNADISNFTTLTAFGCDNNPGEAGEFVVKAWFDTANVPSANFTSGSWTINGETVAVSYQQ